jgi:hypothetical protein
VQRIDISQFEKMIEELERECFAAEQRLLLQRDEQQLEEAAQRTKHSVQELLETAGDIMRHITSAVDQEEEQDEGGASGEGDGEDEGGAPGEGGTDVEASDEEEDVSCAVPVGEKVPLEKATRLLR